MIKEQPSLTPSLRLERKQMLDDGTVINQERLYTLTNNYVASSSSRAASLALARSASGPLEWKTEAGIPLKTFE